MDSLKFQYFKISIALLLGFFVYGVSWFSTEQNIVLGFVSFLIVLWTNHGLPLAVVSLLPIIVFPVFGVLSTSEASVNYANPIVFLFLGGFLLAIAVEKTNLHQYLANIILSIFPKTLYGIITALVVTSGMLSAVLSNTTTAILLIPLALYLSDNAKIQMRFALAIAYGASIGGIITPIGTPPNLIFLGIMQQHNLAIIPFFKWISLTLPLAAVMMLFTSYLLSLGTADIKLTIKIKHYALTKQAKYLIFILICLIVVLFLNELYKSYGNHVGLSEAGILLGTGLLLFIHPFKILDWNNDKDKIPFGIMFLFGAGFCIASAFSHTGLANVMASELLHITTHSLLIILIVVAVFITFSTEITSNTALISIVLPILYAASKQAHLDTSLVMMVATISASYAFMLPIATPPNAVAISTEAVTTSQMLKYGIILNIMGILSVVVMAKIYWQFII